MSDDYNARTSAIWCLSKVVSMLASPAVQRDAPDLAEKVRGGQMALDAADRERKRRLAATRPTSTEGSSTAS